MQGVTYSQLFTPEQPAAPPPGPFDDLDFDDCVHARDTTCPVEVDVFASDILNAREERRPFGWELWQEMRARLLAKVPLPPPPHPTEHPSLPPALMC